MSRQVRSRLDIALGRTLLVGQTWRCGCCRLHWRIRQVHRADCTAELVYRGETREISFKELRTGWEQVETDPGKQGAKYSNSHPAQPESGQAKGQVGASIAEAA